MAIMSKCLGFRIVKNHGGLLVRECGNDAKHECPACDTALCLKCSKQAKRHRKKCYGGNNI